MDEAKREQVTAELDAWSKMVSGMDGAIAEFLRSSRLDRDPETREQEIRAEGFPMTADEMAYWTPRERM